MDPQATLDQVEIALRERDYSEAFFLLAAYWKWRTSGGFEPTGGDQAACALMLDAAVQIERDQFADR